jgi:hypothetical protein
MQHIQLKFVPNFNKYTVAKIEQKNAIKCINIYPADHPDHKMEHKSMFITYERLMELQPIAIENGYLFVY